MNRRRFIAASAAVVGALLAADAGLVEPRRLEVTRHDLDPHPAPGRAHVTLAQVSDLHLTRIGRIHHHLAERLADARPDLVVITGDAIDRADALPDLTGFLSLLDRTTPKYAILGNWDHWSGVEIPELERVYDRFGVRLLVNETVVHE
ncbi:MAG: metallophosphoesterase, partial [Gemmatimonadetes bacterium]|nr:metallophosphoesterase [Gemmatimonadota bacterium]